MTLRTACIVSGMWIVLTTPVLAQGIYRCGPSGATYSQLPCADGRRFEPTDARNDEQRLQALHVNERTVALAESLERERLASEAVARSQRAGSFNSPTKKVSAKASRSTAQAKAKQRLRLSSQAVNRRAPKATQDAALAQARP